MTRAREIAKFFCGFEAFHALVHGYLWGSGTDLTVMGMHVSAGLNVISVFLNGAVALALGLWAWRTRCVA